MNEFADLFAKHPALRNVDPTVLRRAIGNRQLFERLLDEGDSALTEADRVHGAEVHHRIRAAAHAMFAERSLPIAEAHRQPFDGLRGHIVAAGGLWSAATTQLAALSRDPGRIVERFGNLIRAVAGRPPLPAAPTSWFASLIRGITRRPAPALVLMSGSVEAHCYPAPGHDVPLRRPLVAKDWVSRQSSGQTVVTFEVELDPAWQRQSFSTAILQLGHDEPAMAFSEVSLERRGAALTVRAVFPGSAGPARLLSSDATLHLFGAGAAPGTKDA